MKKWLLIACLSPLFVNAQKSMQKYYQMNMLSFNTEGAYYEDQSLSLKLRKQLKIQQVKSIYTSNKGKKHTSVATYNQFGKILHISDKYLTTDYLYENDSLLIGRISNRKGKISETSSTFKNGKLVSKEVIKNGKVESRTLASYNDHNKLSSTQMIMGKKTYEIKYAYDLENKLSKTVYAINGKLKKEWIYECKPEGALVASKTEAISSMCSYREESADGSYTIFTRSLKEGKPFLLKQTFNKDSALVIAQYFSNDTVPIWESKKENNVETVVAFKKSGKRSYKQITVFNDAGSIVSREYFAKNRKKNQTKTVYELNPDGSIKTRLFYWKGKLQGTTDYGYSFY